MRMMKINPKDPEIESLRNEISNIKDKIKKMEIVKENLKHLKYFQIFEKQYDPIEGDHVMITYWLTNEPVPVRIIKRYRNNTYLVSFDVEGSTAKGAPNITIRNSDIISPYKGIKTSVGPGYISSNTNMSLRQVHQVSNDMYL